MSNPVTSSSSSNPTTAASPSNHTSSSASSSSSSFFSRFQLPSAVASTLCSTASATPLHSSSSSSAPADNSRPDSSAASAATSASPAAAAPRPARASDPHSTEWKDISLPKFAGLTVFFSTLENALFYPFFVLKTREQADQRALSGKSYWSATRAHLRTLLADQGVRGLYRGFWASNIMAFPTYGVYMGVYSYTKDALGYQANSSDSSSAASSSLNYTSLYAPFIAGLVADGASVALYVPGDVIVQRLQLKDSPYASFSDACVQIYRNDGVAGFFRGAAATFVTSGIASAVWWVIYENMKKELYAGVDRRKAAEEEVTHASSSPSSSTSPAAPPSSTLPPSTTTSSHSFTTFSSVDNDDTPSLWSQLTGVNRLPQLGAGFIAGTFTSILINPLDVVKTRLQIQDIYGQQAHDAATKQDSCAVPPRNREKIEAQKYRSMWHGLYRIYVDEGIRGFGRGIGPKLVSRGPLSAVSSLLYEVVMHLSKSDEAKKRDYHRFQQD